LYHGTLGAVPAPRVSVIVPTRDRLEPLRRCVDALKRQSLGAELEIVVVRDGGGAPVESVLPQLPGVRHREAIARRG
jgi:Glycosyl transferase family 2